MIQDIDTTMQSTQPLGFITIMSLTKKLAAPFCYATAQLTFPAYLLVELPPFLPLHCFFFLQHSNQKVLVLHLKDFHWYLYSISLILDKKREPHILTTSIPIPTVNGWIPKSVSLCLSQALWRNGAPYKCPLLVSLVFIINPSAWCFIMTFSKKLCPIGLCC